jgi:hypothetical protein
VAPPTPEQRRGLTRHSITVVESELFWLCAIVQLLASVALVQLVQQLGASRITPEVSKLAGGQRQDSWLAAAVIWGMIFCRDSRYSDALFVAGSLALVWLIARACLRIKLAIKERSR